MHMKTYGLLALALLMILALAASAQEPAGTPKVDSATPLTPEDLYQIALSHNPDYLKTVETLGLSRINVLSAWGTLMPTLGVSYGIGQSSSYSPTYVNPDGSVSTYPKTETIAGIPQLVVDTTNWQVVTVPGPEQTVTVPVPTAERRNSSGNLTLQENIQLGGQQFYGIKNARITNRINGLQTDLSKNTLFFTIRQDYYAVLAQKQLRDLAQQVLDQKNDFLKAAQARYEVGSVTELDVLQAEIDVGTQENAVITAENNLKLAREELNRAVGISLDSQYGLVDSLDVFSPSFTLDDLVKEAFDTRPDYRLAGAQVEFQQNQVKVQRGQFLPILSANLSTTRSELSGTNVDFTLHPRNRNTSVNVSLSWNLFNGFSNRAQLEQSQVNLNNSRYELRSQQLAVEKGVRQAYYSLMQTFQKSAVTSKNRELASRQLALEQERYRLGSASQLDLRTAQTTYEQAQSDYIANIYSFWSNLAALEQAVGKRLQ